MQNGSKDRTPRDLWIAVLMQAWRDAFRKLTPRSSAEVVQSTRDAKAWFERGSEDFREVCDNAGFQPDVVRSGYLARASMGGGIGRG